MVTGQRLEVHVARMRPCADESSDVTEESREVIARIEGEGELRMALGTNLLVLSNVQSIQQDS